MNLWDSEHMEECSQIVNPQVEAIRLARRSVALSVAAMVVVKNREVLGHRCGDRRIAFVGAHRSANLHDGRPRAG